MNKRELLNHKYLGLCQKLGDAVLKQQQLTDHIANLKADIASLNETFATLEELDAIESTKKSSNE